MLTHDSTEEEDRGLNVARELARINLPLSTYTEWYWKVDLHNLLHFLSLRADPHAQMEIRAYADEMLKIVRQWVPNIYDAFVDYRLNARTFSGQEMAILRRALAGNPGTMVQIQRALGQSAELSKREIDAFVLNLRGSLADA
jgi:thymidylate synthase (FAD)